MSNNNFIFRDDEPKIIADESGVLDIEKILTQNYQYILDEIIKENHEIGAVISNFFKEILYENQVIGFVTYIVDDFYNLSLNEIYVLPEFRGKRLFLKEVESVIRKGYMLSFTLPNHNLVEILLHSGLASKISDNIVVSAIDFECDGVDIENGEFIGEYSISTPFYDLNIYSPIYIDESNAYYNYELDDEEEELGDTREIIDDDYLNNIKTLIFNKTEEIDNLLSKLKENLPKPDFGFDVIIGEGEDLSLYVQDLVDTNIISSNKAINIVNQLNAEYMMGKVRDDGLKTRLWYLIDNYGVEKSLPDIYSNNIFCDYCYNPVTLLDLHCPKCGFNQFSDDYDFDSFDDVPFNEFEKNLLEQFIFDDSFRSNIADVFSDDDDFKYINMFFDLIGDNNELKNMLFEGLLSDDMENNKFAESFFENVDEDKLEKFFDLIVDAEDEDLSDYFIPVSDVNNQDNNLSEFFDILSTKYFLYDTDELESRTLDFEIAKILNYIDDFHELEPVFIFNPHMFSMSKKVYENFLTSEGFITDKLSFEIWQDFAPNLTVKELKDILRDNSLKLSGKKQELIDRISENNVNLTNLPIQGYYLTEYGKNYLNDFKWIESYENYLTPNFDFNDFYKFYEENDGEIDDIILNYLDKHLQEAINLNDFDYLIACYTAKSKLLIYNNDFEEALDCEIKKSCLFINPIHRNPDLAKFLSPLDKSIMENFDILKTKYSNDEIIKKFDKIWDELNFNSFILNKDDARNVLKDLLNNNDLRKHENKISSKIVNYNKEQSFLDDYFN